MKKRNELTNGHQEGPYRRRLRRSGAMGLVLALTAALLAVVAPNLGAQVSQVVVEDGESIQAAVDAADPGTTIIVRGDHVENVWVNKSGIRLVGEDATLTSTDTGTGTPCFPDPEAPIPLICVTPESEGIPEPADFLDGFAISGFTLLDAPGDGISTVFVNNVDIRRNTVYNAECDGIFVIFATGIHVGRNDVDGSGCAGINVNAGSDARISRNWTNDSTFNGIAVNDVANVIVRRNIAENNCIGIGVVDGADEGFGIRAEEFDGSGARITANTSNNNNKTCPFGPDFDIGLTGIIVGGVDDVLIRDNTTDNNTGTEPSATAGGIVVTDLPNFDGSLSPTTNVTVRANRAVGNSSPDGPLDLRLESESLLQVRGNHCDVSAPEPSWCG